MARKRKRRKHGKKEPMRTVNFTIGPDGIFSCTAVDVPMATHRRYLELHYTLLPEGVERWSPDQLRAKVEIARVTGKQEDWERALMLLAHHRSELACDLLRELEPRLPEALHGFQQLALGEALGWLGYDYISDEQGRPRVLLSGAPWPEEGPN